MLEDAILFFNKVLIILHMKDAQFWFGVQFLLKVICINLTYLGFFFFFFFLKNQMLLADHAYASLLFYFILFFQMLESDF